MTAYEFVKDIWESTEITILLPISIEYARQDIEDMIEEGFDVPNDLTAEKYMEIWNEIVSGEIEKV